MLMLKLNVISASLFLTQHKSQKVIHSWLSNVLGAAFKSSFRFWWQSVLVFFLITPNYFFKTDVRIGNARNIFVGRICPSCNYAQIWLFAAGVIETSNKIQPWLDRRCSTAVKHMPQNQEVWKLQGAGLYYFFFYILPYWLRVLNQVPVGCSSNPRRNK